MIYIVENERGKQKIVVPDGARLMTAEDEAYFQAEADRITERAKKTQQISTLGEDISKLYIQIGTLKTKLNKTDYQAIKFAEGEMPFEEYAPIKEQRKGWRKEINDLEMLIATKEAIVAELRRA